MNKRIPRKNILKHPDDVVFMKRLLHKYQNIFQRLP